MEMNSSQKGSYFYYRVWDRSLRVFHWVNFICVSVLMGVGLIILFNKSLGISSDGKILLKTIHAYVGYVFVLNLLWRFIWGFVGNRYSRWKGILPFGEEYRKSLILYLKDFKDSKRPVYAGHNPLARLMVSFLFVLLSLQAATGLTLAGTDLYLPPFGHEMAEWVTGSGEDHSKLKNLQPGSKEAVDPEAYRQMREFRKPFITIHVYGFYVLFVAIIIHIMGVVITERVEKSGLISAMFTGNKVFTKKPVDADDDRL